VDENTKVTMNFSGPALENLKQLRRDMVEDDPVVIAGALEFLAWVARKYGEGFVLAVLDPKTKEMTPLELRFLHTAFARERSEKTH
jgi:hypothetical protein